MQSNVNSNISTIPTTFNTNMAMNQNVNDYMNNNVNNLYSNTFCQTWQNMQPTTTLINSNLNNMLNILSLINFPIVVPYHGEHPLVNCFTPNRAKASPNWVCDICKLHYTYNVPSFYCTACDFDICQKCILCLGAYQIVIYNYNMYSLINLNQVFRNAGNLNLKVHNHPIVNIKRDNTYFTIDLKCNKCVKDLQKNDEFYYCTLCNICYCNQCYDQLTEQFVDNPDYLGKNQMTSK